MDSPRSSVPTCSRTVGRDNDVCGNSGSDDGNDDDDGDSNGDDDGDDDDDILTGQSQIILFDMLYYCGER